MPLLPPSGVSGNYTRARPHPAVEMHAARVQVVGRDQRAQYLSVALWSTAACGQRPGDSDRRRLQERGHTTPEKAEGTEGD